MAVGDEIHVVRLLPSHDGATIAASPGPIVKLAVSPDERLLALARKDGTIVVWGLRAKRVLQTLSGHDRAVFGVAFVPGPGRRGWFRLAEMAWSRSGTPRPAASRCTRCRAIAGLGGLFTRWPSGATVGRSPRGA